MSRLEIMSLEEGEALEIHLIYVLFFRIVSMIYILST